MFTSEALTKVHSIILLALIVVVALGGSATYVLLSGHNQSFDAIKIGVLADLDGALGRNAWQAAILAAEQINVEGGILGRQVEVIGEDHDVETGIDIVKVSSALTRLITYHKADFIIGQAGDDVGFVCQDIISEHKKILLSVAGTSDELSQRVLNDYDKYKYYFKVMFNASTIFQGMSDSLLLVRENTGFNKVGYLGEDLGWTKGIMEGLDYVLSEVYGFDLVYKGAFPLGTVDFSSYFAAAETAGVEILIPLIAYDGGIPFVKEYYDRQSPLFVYGGVLLLISVPESWEWTDGKCEHIVTSGGAVMTGYPLTSKTLSAIEDYFNRWGETPSSSGSSAYDILRFILPDAINRAGTIEVDAVIEALEETSVETSGARNFVFTSSHDVLVGENPTNPEVDYTLILLFQWQNGEQVPVYPQKIMEEAGATYTYPDWPGPWD